MGAQKKIEVKSLAWKDSWDLFQKYVGEDTLNSDPEIPEQAEIVARECCGLPLVIITIGRAMASKVTPQDWKHAIRVLQTSASKFPEDFSIDKEALIWKWICEGFLDEYDDMDGAKNQGFNIISTLIHACLLEEPLDTNSVKLHDVIRDMALWITGEMGEMKGKILRFPVGMKNLVKLKRLGLACTFELSSIPRGLISSLSMLQTINLYRCGFEPDGNESLVEELESLKYLINLRITIVSACVFERFLSSRKLRSCTHGICLTSFKGSISLNVSSLENIKHLNSFWMEFCDTLIKFDWAEKGKETVEYSNLNPKVKCFDGLETVTILRCRMLKNLTWLIFAPNLKYLDILYCEQMEEVIGKGEEDGGNLSPFTNLIQVQLLYLPQLKSMYWNPPPFLHLERILVVGCPKLKKLPLNSNSARERRVMIEGEEEWWNELEWEDEATLNTFLPNFQALDKNKG
ncbi:putative disease resistance protein [Vitis vinifera]|uniref:Putative disease resistance protein n=1 Tax=Vitis vinifera TaxID=29760 RepID=A0A438D624_VITVI|nr:putative disease resistance protein [Vitis vinifera]